MRKKILVIDDERQVHELIESYLFPYHLDIYDAYNGEEGVKKYRELMAQGNTPDLVVMDLNLSGSRRIEDMLHQFDGEQMDGLQTTREIKRIDPNARIIGFTAFANVKWGEILKNIGAEQVFGRDIGFDGFAQEVAQLLA